MTEPTPTSPTPTAVPWTPDMTVQRTPAVVSAPIPAPVAAPAAHAVPMPAQPVPAQPAPVHSAPVQPAPMAQAPVQSSQIPAAPIPPQPMPQPMPQPTQHMNLPPQQMNPPTHPLNSQGQPALHQTHPHGNLQGNPQGSPQGNPQAPRQMSPREQLSQYAQSQQAPHQRVQGVQQQMASQPPMQAQPQYQPQPQPQPQLTSHQHMGGQPAMTPNYPNTAPQAPQVMAQDPEPKSLLGKLLKRSPKPTLADPIMESNLAAAAAAPTAAASGSLFNKNFLLGAITGLVIGAFVLPMALDFLGGGSEPIQAQAISPAQAHLEAPASDQVMTPMDLSQLPEIDPDAPAADEGDTFLDAAIKSGNP